MDFKLHERINKAIFHATNSTLPLEKKFRGKWRLTKMWPSHNFVAFTQFGPLSIFKKISTSRFQLVLPHFCFSRVWVSIWGPKEQIGYFRPPQSHITLHVTPWGRVHFKFVALCLFMFVQGRRSLSCLFLYKLREVFKNPRNGKITGSPPSPLADFSRPKS